MQDIIALAKIKRVQAVIVLFGLFFLWWLWFNLFNPSPTHQQGNVWTSIYMIFSLFGFTSGIIVFHSFGGFKTALGRAIFAFSLGLLFQSFGQTTYTYYLFFKHIDIPYPSIGDIGFFGSIPIYFYGITQLAKAFAGGLSLKSFGNKIQVFILPLTMLFVPYYFFFHNYVFDWSHTFRIFLDFGYPLGDAICVSIAVLTFTLSKKILPGTAKGAIMALIAGLTLQYISDYTYLYQTNIGFWQAGGINDLTYCTAYFVMTLGIIYTCEVSKKVKQVSVKENRVIFASVRGDSELIVENPELAAALRKGFMAMIFKRMRFSI